MGSTKKCHIPMLQTCCLINSLRSGTLYIAVLCMVGALNDFFIFYTQYDRMSEYVPLLRRMRVSKEDRDLMKLIALIVLGSFVLMWFIISAVLSYGAIKRRRKLLVPWMILCGASLPICLVTIITVATLLFIYMSPVYGSFCIVLGIVMLGVPTYFLLVVYSFYRELEEEEEEERSDEIEKGPFIVHPHHLYRQFDE